MARQTLFGILLRSPWWLSFVAGAGLFAVSRLLIPDPIALSVALPFVAIGSYAAWRQLRTPSSSQVAERLAALRAMSWEDFSTLIQEGFRHEGYTVTKVAGDGTDYELTRNGRNTVLNCRRWKVAQTGVAPLRELSDAKQTRGARECIYVSAGQFTTNAREFAAKQSIQLLEDVALVQLTSHGARGRMNRH